MEQIKLTESQLRTIIENTVKETLSEENLDELRAYDNAKEKVGAWLDRFSGNVKNKTAAIAGGMKDMAQYGGTQAFKQGYNDRLARSSEESARKNDEIAQQAAQSMNVGYSQIPACQKIANKYNTKINTLQQEIDNLESNKKQEMAKARKDYQSRMGTRAGAYGGNRNTFSDTSTNANTAAVQALSNRRANLGLEPQQYDGVYRKTGTLQESYLNKIIRESIRKNLNGLTEQIGGSSAPSASYNYGKNSAELTSAQGGIGPSDLEVSRVNDDYQRRLALNQDQDQNSSYKAWCEKNWGDLQKAKITRGCRAYDLACAGRYKEAYDAY